jgi:hypothetical protein
MILLEEALEKFNSFDPEVIFIVNSERFTDKIGELSEKYGSDLNDLVLLSLTGDFSTDQEFIDYLTQEKGLSEEIATQVFKDLSKIVLEPMAKRLAFLSLDPDRGEASIRLEKEYLREVFSTNLLAEFRENPFVKNAFNLKIFDLLERDFNLKLILEKALYENKELLTAKKIKVRNKEVEATVGNWLKDFISKKGNDNFTVVDLSDYLANSENVKNLSETERINMGEILFFYRNLRFFEAMVEDKPMEEWRILPFEISALRRAEAKQKEKIIEDTAVEEESFTQKLSAHDWDKIKGLERRALLEELGVSKTEFDKWYKLNKL